MSSQAFLNEFEKHLFKTKTYGTTINKGNYQNYAQKYNPQNRQNHQTFKPRTPVPYNNRQPKPQIRHKKDVCDRNGTQLQGCICHIVQQCPEKHDTYYTQEMVLHQSN